MRIQIAFVVVFLSHVFASYADERRFVPGTSKFSYDDCSDIAPILDYNTALACFTKYVRYNNNYVNRFNGEYERQAEEMIGKYCCNIEQIRKTYKSRYVTWSGYFIYIDLYNKERSFEVTFMEDGSISGVYQETLN